MKTSYPFYPWMPKPLGALVLLALFVPLFFSGGTYLSNVNEMAGSMATLTEDFQFLSLCASIGMSMMFPFMLPYLQIRNVKHVYLCGFALLTLLNGLCAVVQSLPVLTVCCFLTGFVRVALVLNTTFVLAPYLLGIQTLDMFLYEPRTPQEAWQNDHARTLLMPVLYAYILCIVQLSNYVAARVAYDYAWPYTYSWHYSSPTTETNELKPKSLWTLMTDLGYTHTMHNNTYTPTELRKQRVLEAIRKHEDNIDIRTLETATGMPTADIAAVIETLARENRILLRLNHSDD